MLLQSASGNTGWPMLDRFGAWVIRPAGVLYVFAMMMISLCKEYWQFMLAQGVLTCMVMGFLQFPFMAVVSQFFNKKRAAVGSDTEGIGEAQRREEDATRPGSDKPRSETTVRRLFEFRIASNCFVVAEL
ncbi:hypothetical protein AAE478_006232 [Parahypoxylon ruwenzoriense]